MGKCLFMRKGETHTAPVSYKTDFADNTWAQIIDACQKNAVPDAWLVGDQKAMTINGTDYAIDIIGKNHDDYADGSGKAPLTFQMHDCYNELHPMNETNNNSGGWTSCVMRSTYLPAILALMPSDVQTGLKEVVKKTGEGNQSGNIVNTNDKLFLLSEKEVFGTAGYSASGEGNQYEYYAAGNSRIKKYNNSPDYWWLRSPVIVYSSDFCFVKEDGTLNNRGASLYYSFSFAFCF